MSAVCGRDEELRREVDSLLACASRSDDFLEKPAAAVVAADESGSLRPAGTQNLTGRTLSHYQILDKLGEGGMAVVYKARDTRLGRSVALKFVKVQFSERFEREARAVARLNHPHIATLYEVGEQEGAPYLAMEFVEGKPLKGPRPVKEVIEYGIQIADALSVAHTAGIVHRDLKPANILATGKGSVKILDFGIAKLTGQALDGQPMTATLTGIGAGTPGYMSPEQIDGKPADTRSDIFAFGCVLYELVSGRHAFEGDSISQVLSATAAQEPKTLDAAPAKLDELIRRCLRKDPERRLQHIGDARIALEELREESESGKLGAAQAYRPAFRRGWTAALAAGAVVLAAVGWLWFSRSRPAAPEAPLTAVPVTSFSGFELFPSFSPDGSQMAFSWNGEREDNYDIYITVIGSGRSLRLTTDPSVDSAPAWSPDGRQIAFLRYAGRDRAAVMLISPLGGPERRLAELDRIPDRSAQKGWYGYTADTLTWHRGGKQLAVIDVNALILLSIETGEKRRLTTPPQALIDANPAFSPDGRSLAFFRRGNYAGVLYRLSLDDGLRPEGEPVRLTPVMNVACFPTWTADGREINFSAGPRFRPSLWKVAVSGPGKPQRLTSVGEGGTQAALTRDGRRLVYSRVFLDTNIWRIEISGRQTSTPRRTRLIASSGYDSDPQFSPDGSKIAFDSNRSGTPETWVCDSDGSNPVQVSSFGGPLTGAPHWSPDGQEILFDSRPYGNADIFVVGVSGGKPRPMTANLDQDILATWSRDGKWIYFQSNRTGRTEVWKMPVARTPASGEPIQVTRDGGGGPVFESHDGKLLYYRKSGGVWQIPAEGGKATQVIESVFGWPAYAIADNGIYFIPRDEPAVRFLDFKTRATRTIVMLDESRDGDLAVSPDGQTILYSQMDSGGSDLMLVENFR